MVRGWFITMELDDLFRYRQKLVERFERVGDDLESLAELFPPDWVDRPFPPDQRSLLYCLAHMKDMEQQEYLPALLRITTEDRPQLSYFDWTKWNIYEPGLMGELLGQFRQVRGDEMVLLAEMPVQAWNRLGRHPVWWLRTLQWWVEHSLAHSRKHFMNLFMQVQTIMGSSPKAF